MTGWPRSMWPRTPGWCAPALRTRPGPAPTVWMVKARMNAIRALGRQLHKDGIEIVTLESTSDYWRIWVRREAHCRIARAAGGNWRRCSRI